MTSLVCAKPSTPQWRASMDEKKIEEVMTLVDKYGNAVEDHARGSKGGAIAENQAYDAIKQKLRQLLGEQHG